MKENLEKNKSRGLKQILFSLYNEFLNYPTPINLSYLWNFGSISLFSLLIQIVSGFLLSLWYVPSVNLAFDSVEYIMREVNYGWFIRYLHSNGASLFFFAVYVHMARGMYYGSYIYPREKVWYSGFIMFLLMIVTAFFGYVLPWGQMSYWAATVISSLITVIPGVGIDLLSFIWGGIAVEQPTLTRIFGFHFILPFVILSLVIVHLVFLHEHGSNNPLGIKSVDNVSFYPYFFVKDVLGIYIATFILLIFVFFYPNALSHPDNYIPANPSVTPLHIVPEWYFLPFYGILRSVPNKAGGAILVIFALLLLGFLPLISRPIFRSGCFRPLFQVIFWLFIADYILLGWSGSNPVATPYYEICQAATVFYFAWFIILNPVVIKVEYIYFYVKTGYWADNRSMTGRLIRKLFIKEVKKEIKKK